MDHDKNILILTVSLLAFTVFALLAAIYRRVYLERYGREGEDYADHCLYANDQIVNECLRLVKHVIIVLAVLYVVRGVDHHEAVLSDPGLGIIHVLLNSIAGVGCLIGTNSAYMLWRRHKRFQHFTRTRP